MATITKGRTFVSGEVVTPSKLNTLVDSATISGIVTADISDSQITTAKIADANVTTAKIADSNVTTAKIADANVTTAKIADGAITSGKLASTVILVPTGAVMPFAMNSAPSGWLAANGSAVSRTTYSALWTALGTTTSPYGQGDGSTTFNLPDLRGYFVRGAGSDGTATAGAFGVKQADAFQGHKHSSRKIGNNMGFVSNGSYLNQAHMGTATNGASGTDVNLDVATDGTNGTPRTAAETRPANIPMLYCIKA